MLLDGVYAPALLTDKMYTQAIGKTLLSLRRAKYRQFTGNSKLLVRLISQGIPPKAFPSA
jgi:hypothetical protein